MAIALCFLFLSIILSGNSEELEKELTLTNGTLKVTEVDQIFQSLKKVEEIIKGMAKSAVRFSLPFFMKIAEEANLSSSCVKSGIQFLKDFLQLKSWTLRLLDSLGKPSSGILNGMFWLRGDYDQCLKIGNPFTRKNEIIHGKYCAIMIELESPKQEIFDILSAHDNNTLIHLLKDFIKPLQLSELPMLYSYQKIRYRFDVCLPRTCTEDDLNNIIKLIKLPPIFINIRLDFCTTKERKINYTTSQIVSVIFFSVFFIWVALATTVDAMQRLAIMPNDKTNVLKNITSVSALTSGKKLFSATLWKRTSALCGIKTLIIQSIVFGHLTYFSMRMMNVTENYINIVELFDYFPLEVSFNGLIMIETFFFISGFIITYFKKSEEHLWFRQILLLLNRIIRMTIPVLCALATAVILSLIADGPHSLSFIQIVNNLVENWWHYVFHVYNLFEHKHQMVNHFWFISALVQLNILTSPFLFVLNRWPKYGKLFLIVAILAGFAVFATIISIGNIYTIFGYSFRVNQFYRSIADIYIKPFYSHLSSYCLGLLIGSVIQSKTELKFRKDVIAFLWIVAAVLLGLAIFGLHGYIREEFPNENILLVHKIFSPFAWTIGIAWVCVACITGNGGVIHWFLSLRFFVVLDRLNVWIYLLHPIFLLYTLAQLRTTQYISEINLWMLFSFIMLFTVIASALAYIFLQIPLDFLFNKLFGRSCLKKNFSTKVYNLEIISIKNLTEK